MESNKEILIEELNKEIEEEINKSPDQMDTDKIRAINFVIARLEGNTELPKELEKEKFFREFEQEYGFYCAEKTDPGKNILKIGTKRKIIAAVIAMCILLGLGNTASAIAIDKSLWQIFKETTHGFYYFTHSNDGTGDEIQNTVEEPETFTSWQEAVDKVSFPLLNLEYLPAGLELQYVETMSAENIETVQGYFNDGDKYLDIMCEYADTQGTGIINKSTDFEKKDIGDKEVYVGYADINSARFTVQDVLYVINTNLDTKELEEIVRNMK